MQAAADGCHLPLLALHTPCRLEISLADMCSFFDPAVDTILERSRTMLQRLGGDMRVDSILLVGGMSASAYVVKRLREGLQGCATTVLTPTFAYAAVVEGPMSVRERLHV